MPTIATFKSWPSFLSLLCLLILPACNTTSLMAIPEVTYPTPQAIEKSPDEQSSFVLRKVVANIRRGTPIINFPSMDKLMSRDLGGTMCNYLHEGESTIEWGSGSSFLGNWSSELGEVFYEVMSNANLNVAGDPTDLFEGDNKATSAEYQIGARITDIKGNMCQVHHFWDGRPLNEYSGEVYVKVEWIVYSSLTKKQILKVQTEGYRKQKETKKNALMIMFHDAFAGAAENFAQNDNFQKIVLGEADLARASQAFSGPHLYIKTPLARKTSIKSKMDDTLAAVMTIRAGMGHGSGFAISTDGHILTNAHVVGKAKRVSLVLSNGIETVGTVIRSDENRDVALIKTDIRFPNPLALHLKRPKLLEKVYVIGSPILEELQSTVSTGIVSAFSKLPNSDLPYIQSDVAISPGNSGGPMLNTNGNVIGLSVAVVAHEKAENLSLFIPILEALEALKVKTKS